MRFVEASAAKDLRRWWQDRAAILLWLGIPLVVGALITLMTGSGDNPGPRGTLLIADQDNSLLSRVIAGAYGQGELGELISVEQTSLETGRQRVEDGEVSALLVIPAGFGMALLEQQPATLELTTNPTQTILPGIIIDVTEILLDAGFYVQQLFGDEITAILDAAESDTADDAFTAAIAVALQQKFESLAAQLFPPALAIDIAEPPAGEPSPSFALLFMPGIIMMAVMFTANGAASDFWKERDLGALRRLVSAPARVREFVTGKALAAGLLIAAISMIALALGFAFHGLRWANLLPAALWVTLSGVAVFAWMGTLQMATSSMRAAEVISSVVLFPLLMAGGSFFPLAVMPDWLAAIGRATPNGFVTERLTAALTASQAWSIAPASWAIVIVAAAAGLGACALRLKRFARG